MKADKICIFGDTKFLSKVSLGTTTCAIHVHAKGHTATLSSKSVAKVPFTHKLYNSFVPRIS